MALGLSSIARGYGKKVKALLTNMDQPLGRYAGNSLEVDECLQILRNDSATGSALQRQMIHDTRELSLQLAAQMLLLGGADKTIQGAYKMAEAALDSGKAYEKFELLCQIHQGRLSELPQPKHQLNILADEAGIIQGFQTEKIGLVGIQIKAGRAVTTDKIEPTAGIEFHQRIGAKIQKGDILFTLHGADKDLLSTVVAHLKATVVLGNMPVAPTKLIWKEI